MVSSVMKQQLIGWLMWHVEMMSWFGTRSHSREFMRKQPTEQTAASFMWNPTASNTTKGKSWESEKQKRQQNALPCSGMEKIRHGQLCEGEENHWAGNDTFKTHFIQACSSVYSRAGVIGVGHDRARIDFILWANERLPDQRWRNGNEIGFCSQAPWPYSTILDTWIFLTRPPWNWSHIIPFCGAV